MFSASFVFRSKVRADHDSSSPSTLSIHYHHHHLHSYVSAHTASAADMGKHYCGEWKGQRCRGGLRLSCLVSASRKRAVFRLPAHERVSFLPRKDYCDVFLTHDSTSGASPLIPGTAARQSILMNSRRFPLTVRKAHNSGRNHLQNVRDYYACK